MIRTFITLAAVAVVFGATAVAAPPLVTLGESFEGDLTGTEAKPMSSYFPPKTTWAKKLVGGGFQKSFFGYASLHSVKLKGGQTITLAAKVKGDRNVVILFLDPTNLITGMTTLDENSTSFTIKDLPASGIYTVIIFSESIGKYTLKITLEGESTKKELIEKIERLEKELTEAKKQLKVIEEKENKENKK
jgi:hypothetical protein